MEKRVINSFLLGILLVLVISFSIAASADFGNPTYQINTNYSRGSSISGYLNVSFTNEPVNATFTDSFGNSVPLKSLLSGSTNYAYNCSFPNCNPSYSGSSPKSSKQFDLAAGVNKTIGFLVYRNVSGVNSIALNISSNAAPSADNQIEIDLLGNRSYSFVNYKKSNEIGNPDYGCYNSSSNPSPIAITTNPLCQNISINRIPDIELGGWFNGSSTTAALTMALRNTNGAIIKNCEIPHTAITPSGEEAFCDLNFSVQAGNYYVCVSSSPGNYYLMGYASKNDTCGFPGLPPAKETAAYSLAIKPFKFATPGIISIGKFIPDSDYDSIPTLIDDYISTNYPQGCEKGCYIPITLISSESQSITASNLLVTYTVSGLGTVSTANFYDLLKTDSLVNSTLQTLSLGSFFKIPFSVLGNTIYNITLNGTDVLNKVISVQEFPMELYPTSYAVNFPAAFQLSTPSNVNINQYAWKFGDNSSSTTTTGPSVSHTYNSTGNYTLVVSAYYDGNYMSKDFTVQILPAKDFINQEFSSKKSAVTSFENQIASFDTFQKKTINDTLGVNNVSSSFKTIETLNASASSESDYEKILSEIIGLKVPKSMTKTSSTGTPLVVESKSIDLNTLGKITGTQYPAEGGQNYASYWDFNNVDSAISFLKLKVDMDDGNNIPLNFYTLSLTPKRSLNESYYVVFPNSAGFNFENSSGVISKNGYSYVKVGSSPETIQFSTSQDLGSTYNFFIAPEIIEGTVNPSITPTTNNSWIVILGIAIVLIMGIAAYFFLKRWYSKKYEKYLFPDKNQLYNAIFYINNSVKNGVEEDEVRKNLSKAGWKGEQITYLMKKYHGKKTGM